MKVFFGLGNPGNEYAGTRHNVGKLFLDYCVEQKGLSWQDKPKLQCRVAKSQNCLLAFPTTYMNLSGHAAEKIISYFGVSSEDFILVHDDLDIQLGEYKVHHSGPRDHNGVLSVQEHIPFDMFLRVRIGVENRDRQSDIPGSEYVLQRFLPSEKDILYEVFKEISLQVGL